MSVLSLPEVFFFFVLGHFPSDSAPICQRTQRTEVRSQSRVENTGFIWVWPKSKRPVAMEAEPLRAKCDSLVLQLVFGVCSKPSVDCYLNACHRLFAIAA